jgi:molecular chaperone DnaK (HSP70)
VDLHAAKRSVIFAFILKKLKKIAEEFTGQTIKDVVISVPNSFNMVERKGIREAGIVSGLNVLSLINDSIAAGLTCVYEKVLCSKNVLVFDLGGGSLSVGIMDIDIEGGETVIPQAIGGSKNLGGSNFNYSMVNHFVKQIKNQNGIDITGNAKAMNKLKSACEMAKRIVSFENKAEFFVDCNEVKDFKFIITREKFQKLNEDLFQRCEETVTKCLSDAKVTKDDIRYIVLVGGSTRIPHIQNRLKLYFNHDIVFKSINRDEAVAYGAAIQCAIMRGEDKAMKILALDRTPFSLGLEKNTPERSLSALLVSTDTLERGVMHVVIPKNSILPASRVVTAGCEKDRGSYIFQSMKERAEIQKKILFLVNWCWIVLGRHLTRLTSLLKLIVGGF